MTDSSDPMENRTHPERSRKPEGVADRLLRRKSAAGVALPQIRRRLARITRASGKIRKNRLVLPGSAQRERIKDFSATLRQKQAKGPRVGSRVPGNQRQVSWEQMDMSLPNGAPAESSRSNVLRAGLGDMGIPSGGQVIAPFSTPASSNEPSFMERRQARIGAQESKKPAASWKKPERSSRLFSRVEEVKPSRDEQAGSGAEKPPVKDQDLSKSSSPREPEPTSKKPTITPGKSTAVQREMVHGADPMPHSPQKEPVSEIRPAAEIRTPALPDATQEETQKDLKTLAPRKPAVKPAVETRQDAPAKARQDEASYAPIPVSKDAPAPADSPRKDRPQAAPAPKPALTASPKPQTLPESPRQTRPQSTPLPHKTDESKPAERIEENKAQPFPPSQKPSAASVSHSRIQREPERGEKTIPARLPTAQEPAETPGMDATRQPLEQPLASRKTPARQEENLTPGAPALKIPSEEQLRPVEKGKPFPAQPPAPAQKSVSPDQPAASKTAGQPPEKSFVEPQAGKPVVFRTVLARQRDKTRRADLARVQTRVMRKAIRPVKSSPAALPHRIAARGKPDLIHRQMRRAASGPSQQRTPVRGTLQTPGFGGDQRVVARPVAQPLVSPSSKTRPQGSTPGGTASTVLPLPVFSRPPLRLSLRPLTASKAKPALGNVPRQRPRQTVASNKTTGMRAVGAEHLPLLLTQRGLLPRSAAGKAPGLSKPDVIPARRTESVSQKQGTRIGLCASFFSSCRQGSQGRKDAGNAFRPADHSAPGTAGIFARGRASNWRGRAEAGCGIFPRACGITKNSPADPAPGAGGILAEG